MTKENQYRTIFYLTLCDEFVNTVNSCGDIAQLGERQVRNL